MTHTQKSYLVLFGFIVLCLGAGGLGGYATSSSVTSWFPTLVKPAWNPPGWLFGPVWTTLYIMMAVAMWLVWKTDPTWTRIKPAAILFGSQLLLNVAWSFLFFGARSPGLALIDIIALWLAIVATIYAFYQHSKWAAWLLIPYLAWVSFASVLNFTIWRLNG
jgi:translocator protein